MLRAPDSYRARVVPGQGEATEGLPPRREPCPLASQRCPGRAGAGRVITRGEHGGVRDAAGRARDPAKGDRRARRPRFSVCHPLRDARRHDFV